MSFKIKLLLTIVPLIVIPIVLITLIFFMNVGDDIKDLQMELMSLKVENLKDQCRDAQAVLQRAGYESLSYYLRSSQSEIIGDSKRERIPGGHVFILNSDGKVVSQPGGDWPSKAIIREIAGKREGEITSGGDSKKSVFVFRYFPDWDWILVATAKEKTILKAVYDARRMTLFTTGTTILLAVLISFLFVGTISRPIKILEDGTRRISEGNFDVQVPIGSRDEIGRLSRAFNTMAGRVRDLVEHLRMEVAEREQAERAMRQSEERFREMAENIREVFWLFDLNERRVVYLSPAYETIWGRSIEALYSQNEAWTESVYPDDLPDAEEKFREIVQSGGGGEREYRIVRPDGALRWISDKAFTIKDEKGCVYRIAGIAEDVTERKETELALQQSEERYRSLVENTLDGYFISEVPSGRFLFLNQRICDLCGYTMQEGLDLTIWDVVVPGDHVRLMERIQARLDKKRLGTERRNYTVKRKDQTTFDAEVSPSLVTFQGKLAAQGVLRDVTKQERLRQQFQQAQKMEAIGTLAGGIAHDFNNLLMGIQGRSSLMLLDMNSSHPHYEHLKGIEEFVRSAANLTKHLLGFARGGKYEVKPTDLNEIVKNSSRMFGRTKKEIRIHKKLEKDPWTTEVDQGQIEQVLMNLYVNAWQAMPGGGDLYLETKNVFLDEYYVKPFEVQPGRYVKISVTDTGVGMEAATRERIFDPFFTTKEMGMGTGLGLASVFGIVTNHGGIVNVYSEKGEGTTFNIYLPASDREVKEEGEHRAGKILRGSETVLLVDDEKMILDVGRAILTKLGYEVLTAGNGEEAVGLYREKRGRIAVIILDMIMPGMGGGETYDLLKEIDPEVRVLLSSGYSVEGRASKILERGCNGFLQKPFDLMELSQKLREILDGR